MSLRPCLVCAAGATQQPLPGVLLCDAHLAELRSVLAPSAGVVYYAWIPAGVPRIGSSVKIGYSASVQKRMGSLGADLLATEPGGRKLEAQRHREWAHLRVEREYFRPEEELMTHVERLAGHRVERL